MDDEADLTEQDETAERIEDCNHGLVWLVKDGRRKRVAGKGRRDFRESV